MSTKKITLLLALAAAGTAQQATMADQGKPTTSTKDASSVRDTSKSNNSVPLMYSMLTYEGVALGVMFFEIFVGKGLRDFIQGYIKNGMYQTNLAYVVLLLGVAALCAFIEYQVRGEESKDDILFRGLGYFAAISIGALVGGHMVVTDGKNLDIYFPLRKDKIDSMSLANKTDSWFKLFSLYIVQGGIVAALVALKAFALDQLCGCDTKPEEKAKA